MSRVSLNKVSTDKLQNELRRRARGMQTLQKKRERLIQQIQEIDAEIESIGGEAFLAAAAKRGRPAGRAGASGRARGGSRRRPRNEMNLVDALSKLLANKTMSVTEAAEAVQQAGYKTTSSSFRTIVNQTLINSGNFKRVSRGKYTAK
ncbi:MAG: hypothetical protein EA376_05255 [Phycisphaeraceae bacterium]|nr:MAG: hypothetical protein EA376_05255 [Phycisphaeraceae bacterium]